MLEELVQCFSIGFCQNLAVVSPRDDVLDSGGACVICRGRAECLNVKWVVLFVLAWVSLGGYSVPFQNNWSRGPRIMDVATPGDDSLDRG